MLRAIASNIWVVEQPLMFYGLEFGTRMTVIRLNNHELLVISPIKVDDRLDKELQEIGKIVAIVAPNLYHHLFINEFQKKYPTAKTFAATGLEKKRSNLSFDAILTPDRPSIWQELDYVFFEGLSTFDRLIVPLNEFVFYHRESRSLIMTDTAFYLDKTFPLLTRLTARLLGVYEKLQPSILEKIATRDKRKIKVAIERVLTWDFQRVIMAHGTIVEIDAKQQLKEGYEWFLGEKL